VLNNPRSIYFQRCLRIRNLTFNFKHRGIKHAAPRKTVTTATKSGEVEVTLIFRVVQFNPHITDKSITSKYDLIESFNVFHIIYLFIIVCTKYVNEQEIFN
jgi:hypothetical protein